MTVNLRQDYEWFLKANLSRYKGKYIAFANKKILASGADAKKVYQAALKRVASRLKPTLAKIPVEDVLVLLLW